MALTDFLSDEAGNQQGPGTSYVLANKAPVNDWAAEMESLDIDTDPAYSVPVINRTMLPTAPKASRGPEDMKKVPTEPPFTAFIGNLAYEATEEKIKIFFGKLPVVSVRLIEDGGRLRGFGYVEFETRQALIDALAMNEELLLNRKLRVDLAGETQHGENRRGGGGRGGRDEGGPDRTEGNWRSESKPDSAFNDRGPSKFDDRGGPGRYDDRGGPGRYDDRGRDERGGGRYERRGGDRFDDKREERGPWRGGDRDDRHGGDFGRKEDRYGDDQRDDRYGRGGDRYGGRDRHDDRDGGRRAFGSGFHRDEDRGGDRGWERGGGFRGDRGYGGDRDRGYGGDRPGHDREDRQERQNSREAEPPMERPRLHLQPRTKPAERTENEPEPEQKPQKAASIFGNAKPVDTAQREREIEERLMKQREAPPAPKSSLESRGYGRSHGYDGSRPGDSDEKENRNVSRPEAAGRRRSGSDRSEDGDGRRERKASGSSRKKGSVSSTGRSRQDSGEQSAPGELCSGKDEDRAFTAVSPGQPEEPAKLVPAPPPKENIWEKRKSAQTSQSSEPRSPPAQTASSETGSQAKSPAEPKARKPENQSAQQASSPPQAHASRQEPKKEFVPAEPPKENPWTKNKPDNAVSRGGASHPSPSTGPSPASTHGPAPNSWAGRGGPPGGERGHGHGGGRGGAHGRGRGGEQPRKQEKREKPLPLSIDEMPKLEPKQDRDFSDSNKFAGLIDDDENDEEET